MIETDRSLVNFALKGIKRSPREANILAHEKYPESFKVSEETKEKIRQKRVAYLKKNTGKTPFQRRQNGEMSYGEKQLHDLFVKHHIYEQYDVISEYCEHPYFLDFAFVNEKVDVEFDGHWHFTSERQVIDKKRDDYLQQKGWRVFRVAYHELETFDVQKLIDFVGNPNEKQHGYDLIKYHEIRKQRRLQKSQRQLQKKEERDKIRCYVVKQQIQQVLNSNIDFSKYGWVTKASKVIKITPQKVKGWMKRFMFDFYEQKCFKRN